MNFVFALMVSNLGINAFRPEKRYKRPLCFCTIFKTYPWHVFITRYIKLLG